MYMQLQLAFIITLQITKLIFAAFCIYYTFYNLLNSINHFIYLSLGFVLKNPNNIYVCFFIKKTHA